MRVESNSEMAKHRKRHGLLDCIQRPNETLFVPSGWWHTTLNLEPSLAITENFATQSNLDEVLAELAKRPERTPEGRETATAHCVNALQWLVAAESAADSRHRHSELGHSPDAVTTTRYPGPGPDLRADDDAAANASGTGGIATRAQTHSYQSWPAAVRFGQDAPKTHLILFLASKKDALGARRATAALRAVARRAVVEGSSPELVQIVEVQPGGRATLKLMKQFGVTVGDSGPGYRPTVRVATIGATLFRYAPPDVVTHALADINDQSDDSSSSVEDMQFNHTSKTDETLKAALIEWLVAIESGQAKPYLTAADRRVLLALMEHDKK